MLEDDRNAADEFTTMSSVIKSTLKWGGGVFSFSFSFNMLIICKQEMFFNTKSAYVSQLLLSIVICHDFKFQVGCMLSKLQYLSLGGGGGYLDHIQDSRNVLSTIEKQDRDTASMHLL